MSKILTSVNNHGFPIISRQMINQSISISKQTNKQMIPYLISLIFTTTILITTHQVNALGIGSTISVSYGTSNTICGIMAGNTTTQSIQCYTQGETIPISPNNVSFHLISGGHDFFCGLTFDGSSLICWDTISNSTTSSFLATTLYNDETSPLSSLSVGDSQICAIDEKTGGVRCWYRNEKPSPGSSRPPEVGVKFEMITSGENFSCGIVNDEKRVIACWGDIVMADLIQTQFGNTSMMSLVAGKSHLCGLSISGELICKGIGQLNYDLPQKKAADGGFRFSSLALGANNTCAIERNNGSVICWGGGDDKNTDSTEEDGSSFMDVVIASFSFISIVAGMDFTCGLTKDLSLICWGPGWPTPSSFSMSEIPLPTVIPGPCVQSNECGSCGVYPNSTSLCSGINSNICNAACEMVSSSPPPSSPPLPNPTPSSNTNPTPPSSIQKPPETVRSLYWAYLGLGTLGVIFGLSVLLCIIIRTRRKPMIISRRMSRKPQSMDSTGSNVPLTNTPAAVSITDPGSYPSTAQNSRSSSITYRSSQTLVPTRRTLSLSNNHAQPSRAERFTFESLASATENFSGDNIIGTGSFGTVYRGRLSDGRPVAIKREEMLSERKMMMMKSLAENNNNDIFSSAFDSELELLSRLHHKHLVGIVGYCQENEERLLVYEYMSNGTLHDHLFTDKGNPNTNTTTTTTTTLDSWKSRIKIALDAARGIEYLHNYAVPPIIHRDIKSSNILLDSNWIARVSDFGLSLMMTLPLLDQDNNSSSTTTNAAVGTVGYIDPEYYLLKVLTTKSDVYGFGVVLLEILTGKKAVFRSEGEEPEGLVEYAEPYINGGEVWKVLDKRVRYPLLHEAEAVDLVSQTALRCVSLEGKDRPMMSDVVANLEKAFIFCKENRGGDFSRASSMAAASFK